MSSCAAQYQLRLSKVSYLSIRSNESKSVKDIPQNATIAILCDVDSNGDVQVFVKNNTDKIMTIDKTKSFFSNSKGNSFAYYDPTVNVVSESTTKGKSTGSSVNLGAIASAVGVNGPVGTALSGVTVSGEDSNSRTTTNTSYYVDQPQISIAPHAKQLIGRTFNESTFCVSNYDSEGFWYTDSQNHSCNVIVSYSIDEGKSYETISLSLIRNALSVSPINQFGYVNDALREILSQKNNALDEYWYTICIAGKWRWQMKNANFQYETYEKNYIKHPYFVNFK